MTSQAATLAASHNGSSTAQFDALIIGAGFGGIRAMHEIKQLGLSCKTFEAGSEVGGTWYWNCYPGARTDTEAWAYCYSFSKAIMAEWDWKDRMPSGSEVVEYLKFVVDRLNMRKDIDFNTRVQSAVYDEQANKWTVTTTGGMVYQSTYLISAAGLLSVTYDPPFPGLSTFKGQSYMTGRWPKDPVDFTGKRVAIIGSGSTAVQVLPIVAQSAKHVSMFQRTPNFVLPNRNFPLENEHRKAIKDNYEKVWEQIHNHFFAFPMKAANRLFDNYSPAEQQRIFEAGWEEGGFRFVFETFDDIITNTRANEAAAEFVRNKIRTIVKDPKTAELLCPHYPFAVKRPALGNLYFESFNRDNVSLVDVSKTPIEAITPNGILVGDVEHEADIIIFAMGFDAVTGALANLDVRGKGGLSVKEKWSEGPRTHLGITMDGFPNMFMVSGPQTPFSNIPPVIEAEVTWIGKAIQKSRDTGHRPVEATPEGEERWKKRTQELLDATLLGHGEEVGTWFLGANIPGKKRAPLMYFGGVPAYFKDLQDCIDHDFAGTTLASRS